MIGLFEKMFGEEFWNNAVLEATHWNYGPDAIRIREASQPQLTEQFWGDEFNRILRDQYNVKRPLPAFFIDTFYHHDMPLEVEHFKEQTTDLMELAQSLQPFECKDIKIALSEIRKLHQDVKKLNQEQEQKLKIITNLLEEVHRLNQTLTQHGISTAPPQQEHQEGREYCTMNTCYTPTEFVLFGIGAIVIGVMLGVVGISCFKQHCLPDEKEEIREREREIERQQQLLRQAQVANGHYEPNGHYDANGLDNSRACFVRNDGLHETDF
jgi:hypothetical protein